MIKLNYKTLNLTPEQKEYYQGIAWMIDMHGRGEGKTLVMAKAFVENAFSNIGEWFYIYDHHGLNFNDFHNIFNEIRKVFDDIDFKYKDGDRMYKLEYQERNHRIRIAISGERYDQ